MKTTNRVVAIFFALAVVTAFLVFSGVMWRGADGAFKTSIPAEIRKTFAQEFDGYKEYRGDQVLPPFTYVDRYADLKTLDDFKGKFVLVNFWATWCPPCIVELPSLNKLDRAYDELIVLPISTDHAQSVDEITDFLKKKNIDLFAANWDQHNEAQNAIPMRGLPTSYLIGPDGSVLFMFEGDVDWGAEKSFAFFNALLDEI